MENLPIRKGSIRNAFTVFLIVLILIAPVVGIVSAGDQTWTKGATVPNSFSVASITEVNGQGYLVSSEDADSPPKPIQIYDPDADSWSTGASPKGGKTEAKVGSVGKYVYRTGGYDGATASVTNEVERYNTETDTWDTVSSMNNARRTHGVATANGYLYAIAGEGSPNTAERYDPNTDSWQSITAPPESMKLLSAVSIDGKIYAISGSTTAAVYEYDPSSDSWTDTGSLPTNIEGGAATSYRGSIYITGGFNTETTAYKYNPSDGSTVTLDSMQQGKYNHAMTIFNNKIISAGGKTSSSDTVELYSAPKDLYTVSGSATDENGEELSGATITAVDSNGSVYASTTTDSVGQYGLSLENDTYEITAEKDGYLKDSTTVTVSGSDVSGVDLSLAELNRSMSIDTRNYLEHGQTADYTVTIENNTGRYNVTEEAEVTSTNTSVVTVDQNDLTITATNDTSINQRVAIVANYTDSEGNNFTQKQNVTVANKTVDNVGILPTGARLGASIEDSTLQVIIVATMIGAGVAFLSRAFAGLAAQTLIMALGWLGGMVGNGMVIVSFMIALFIGLNVATNIDYQVAAR